MIADFGHISQKTKDQKCNEPDISSVKLEVEDGSNFVAFSEYLNFTFQVSVGKNPRQILMRGNSFSRKIYFTSICIFTVLS